MLVKIRQYIYNILPWSIKNFLITIYNFRFYFTHNDKYLKSINDCSKWFYEKDYSQVLDYQNYRFMCFINYIKKYNPYFKNKLKNIKINSIDDLSKLPILSKIEFTSIDCSISNEKKIVGHTGGSTGISTKFYLFKNDYIERQANLDFFRGMYGYKFKDNIAWFSGKEVISSNDAKKNKFWVKDYINNITYYSTFHLSEKYIKYYIQNINKSKTEYIAGFPSAIYDIAYIWKKYDYPISSNIKAIFPTSEPLDLFKKNFLSEFFNCPVPDQYASSEGAPFIYECTHGNLHYDLNSGIFEKIGDKYLVTSFTTRCMPLLRFDIGDVFNFSNDSPLCSCGSNYPIVKSIEGRVTDFIQTRYRGKITVSNLSNVVKYLSGINKIQFIQNTSDLSIHVKYVSNTNHDDQLLYEMRYRVGNDIKLSFEKVNYLECSKNGKFKMIVKI